MKGSRSEVLRNELRPKQSLQLQRSQVAQRTGDVKAMQTGDDHSETGLHTTSCVNHAGHLLCDWRHRLSEGDSPTRYQLLGGQVSSLLRVDPLK